MQKIAIFVPTLGGGGAERVMVTLANAFARRGFSVDLVVTTANGPQRQNVDDLVRIVDLGTGRVIKALWPLTRYLRREQPDVMLAAMIHANVVAGLAKVLARVRTRLVVSQRNMVSGGAGPRFNLQAAVIDILARWTYARADGISTVSDGVSDDVAKSLGIARERVRTIYNPFDLELLQANAAEPMDHPWFQPGELPVVLGVGRLVAQKDFATLIRAFAAVRKQRPVRLVILGEGEYRSDLQALAAAEGLGADDIQLPGFVANPGAYLARCAVFVLSSRWEGLPGVLIEALASGAPVVSTDCPSGPHEILEGGAWGRLVPVGDVDALADAIGGVLDTSPDKLPDVRQRARAFAIDPAVDAYLELLGVAGQGAV